MGEMAEIEVLQKRLAEVEMYCAGLRYQIAHILAMVARYVPAEVLNAAFSDTNETMRAHVDMWNLSDKLTNAPKQYKKPTPSQDLRPR